MCFDIEAVNVIYLVSSSFIHSPQHQAMILPYYLTDLVDLTLNTLVTSVEDDLKKKKKDICYQTTFYSLYSPAKCGHRVSFLLYSLMPVQK